MTYEPLSVTRKAGEYSPGVHVVYTKTCKAGEYSPARPLGSSKTWLGSIPRPGHLAQARHGWGVFLGLLLPLATLLTRWLVTRWPRCQSLGGERGCGWFVGWGAWVRPASRGRSAGALRRRGCGGTAAGCSLRPPAAAAAAASGWAAGHFSLPLMQACFL